MASGEQTRWNRALLYAGLFLIGLGVFHILVQFVAPRDWESSVGWRKPILFGISTGVTLVSLAWAVSFLNGVRVLSAARIVALLAAAEVLIITVQTWRAVPAHFNNGAIFDRVLGYSVDAMLVVITTGIFYFTYLLFKAENLGVWRLSVRLGMFYLALGCVLGFAVAAYGFYTLGTGGNPEQIAPRGVPKFFHGMPLHAIQILPAWMFVLTKINSNNAKRDLSVWLLSHAIGAATVYAFWQTVNGLGRFELNFVGNLILSAVFVCGATALIIGASDLLARLQTFPSRSDNI